jgi:hypothetical protein
MEDKKNKYADAKVLDWWRDFDLQEYYSIIEVNGEWILSVTKVEDPNGKIS